ncbi:MAG TPA: hypothetical protein DCP32_11240 [Anaerolineaceae bacterium]|nr:MAG: hypothetical protein A2X24_02975 [Chloroflexi bacterium GWB2_54_36]HAL17287.1 hypothetical protein [Anaerolineaceae bacterium]HBA92628.1 hypothetical protein [Anaerolineaceae bacterium]
MSTINLIVQTLHNLTRWGIVILGLVAIIRAFAGWFGKKEYTPADNRAGMLYTIAFDIQFLLGIVLYFSKGWFGVLTADFNASMSSVGTRFFTIDHLLTMVGALTLAHVGRALSRKAADAARKHRSVAIWYGLSFALMLAAVPWPFTAFARPWLRLFGISF